MKLSTTDLAKETKAAVLHKFAHYYKVMSIDPNASSQVNQDAATLRILVAAGQVDTAKLAKARAQARAVALWRA